MILPHALTTADQTPASYQLILASASPARKEILRRAGITAQVRVPKFDEESFLPAHVAADLTTSELVCQLAAAKATALAQQISAGDGSAATPAERETLILGCDSMLEMHGRSWGKPRTAANARARLLQMRGQSGVLHSGHSLVRLSDGKTITQSASTKIHFAEFSDTELEAYLATGEPLQVAGAFTIDGFGGPFITGIVGDYHNVVGLSLPLLRTMLQEFGLEITKLWRNPETTSAQ